MTALKTYLSGRVVVKVGDITQEAVDAIVNAANGSLMGGGGVDGAIHRAGGPEIKAACAEIRRTQYPQGLPTGQAVITTAGKLPAKYVIHTVGPVYGSGGADKADFLAACYFNSLSLAASSMDSSRSLSRRSPPGFTVIRWLRRRRCPRAPLSSFCSSINRLRQSRLVFFAAGDAEVFLKHHSFTG